MIVIRVLWPPLWSRGNIVASHPANPCSIPGRVRVPGWGFSSTVRQMSGKLRLHLSPDIIGHHNHHKSFHTGANYLRCWRALKRIHTTRPRREPFCFMALPFDTPAVNICSEHVQGGQTETPPCFKETSWRRAYTCSGALWFRYPRMRSRFFQISVLCSLFVSWVYEFSFKRYTAEQQIFIFNTFMKKSSWRNCRRKFRRQFPHSPVPDKATICRLVKKKLTRQALCKIRSLKWINGYWQMIKLNKIGFWLEQSPQKSVCWLAQQVGVSKSSVQMSDKKYVR